VTRLRVTLVTMDSHLSTASIRAAESLRAELPGLTFRIHAADRWNADPDALARCREDIAAADILIVTMLFLDDHIRAILPALEARRDHCDAMVCCLAAGEVIRLTRMGRLSMAGGDQGPMAWLKRLRGKAKSGSSGKGQMAMLRQLPRLLRFLPGTAQDLRAYFLTLQYWLAGSDRNIANMIRLLVQRYAAGPRRPMADAIARVAAPVEYPEVGVYHPAVPGGIATDRKALPARPGAVGRVGLLVMRSYLLAGNAAHYDGVIAAMEARGLEVVPAFASGLDQRPAIERHFLDGGRATVDALVSLTGFSLVGGPAYNDARAAEELLARLDVPYLAAHPVEFQTLEHWERDPRGLMPVEATMMVAIPELDGAICPMTFGGRAERGTGAHADMAVHGERAAMLAARVARLVALRRTARAERKLAIVLFNFPPNAGAVGTAAHLSVFESLHNLLRRLAAEGYRVDPPADVQALRERVLVGNAATHGTEANVAAMIPLAEHVAGQPWLAEIEGQWGRAPGTHLTDGRHLFVLGATFGNVLVAIQPGFGFEGDPMRLMFAHGQAPTHAFAAFYRHLSERFGAHAVLHFGTHGALEFMPGKQVGLSADCWPDRLIGDLPNFYLYAANNPSEGTLAKRRGGATLISYVTPPVAKAGLHRGLADLQASIDRWRQLPPDVDPAHAASLAALIQAQSAEVDLGAAEPAWGDAAATVIDGLRRRLHEIREALIPDGLHVVGAPPDAARRASTLDAAGVVDATERARLDRLMATDHELPAIVLALDGRYVRPAPGGDLTRSADVLPSGRNLHAFDPFRLPSAFAMTDGATQAERLLARHRAETGDWPETIAVVLWGTDNIKSEGGPIAQALHLMGAAPRHDGYGRLAGARLVPLEELGRPRIDVMSTLSGIFRDLLPLQTRMLAEAAVLAAAADEPVAMNFVRKHALAFQAAHGCDLETAALRVFGNADGAYGAHVSQTIDHGAWNDSDELAEMFVRRKGFAYGSDGKTTRHDAVLNHLLGTVAATYQNLDSVELGVTTIDTYFDSLGGISRAVRRARGAAVETYIGDQTRNEGKVRTLSEQVALETRTRALNPNWYEPLLAHGHEGVRHLEAQVTNTLGWSATTGAVAPWVYQRLTQTFMLDDAMRRRLATLNPAASARLANRLIEAHERAYWTPDPGMLDALRRAGEELEDRLEGIGQGAAA
jgi:magnesium chelatase subunit H